MTTKTQVNEFSTNPSDYEFIKIIGYGSSAIVHSAVYKPTNQKVAVKLIDMEMFERNQIDELRRETQVMVLCKHENLLPVYSTFVNGTKLHIVSPLLSAGSCLDILKLGYPEGLEESVIACILKQTLLGMEYLHKNGHIHRDIKAGNLLVDDQGTVLLADFGVSSSLSDGGDRQKMRKTFVGTPCWMAPEVMEQAGYDYKADIWSFGITALELANGQAPLAKFPPIKVLMMTLSKDPPTLDRDITKYKYSKSFKEMIDSCLQKDPRKRPTTEKLLQHPFFKQLSKRKQVIHQITQSLPTIEARNIPPPRIGIAQITKLPARGESWNFSPDTTVDERQSYENKLTPGFEEPLEVSGEDSSSINVKVDLDAPTPVTSDLPLDIIPGPVDAKPAGRKSRFVIDTQNVPPNMPTSPNQEPSATPVTATPSLSKIKKSRFSVSDERSPAIPETPSDARPVSPNPASVQRESSKSSRFSVNNNGSPTATVQSSAASDSGDQPASATSIRGRFHVSAEKSDGALAQSSSSTESSVDASSLMVYARQMDALVKQNEQQRSMIEDLRALVAGEKSAANLSRSQSSCKTLKDQISNSLSKTADTLDTTLITFDQMIQNLINENQTLKAENERLKSENEALLKK